MGRAKLKMKLITKEKTRKTTFHKSKPWIIKKANEFTILCEVDTISIIYHPNSDIPEVWPENPNEIKKTIACYKSKKGEAVKRTYGLIDFYEDRKKRLDDELIKPRKKNMEAKYATWFDGFDVFSEVQVRKLAVTLENKENIVRAHLEFRKRNMSFQLPNMIHYQGLGLDHYGHVMMNQHLVNHDRVMYGDVSIGSFMPMKREPLGFGYPVVDGGMVFDGNKWILQQPVVHGGVMQEFTAARQEHELQVNNGVGENVMDDHRGKYIGSI